MKLGIRLGHPKVSSGFSPTDASDLSLWYQNGVGVTSRQWADSSGNNNTADAPTGNEPTPAEGGFDFENDSSTTIDYLDFSSFDLTGAFSMFWVIKMESYDNQNTLFSSNNSNFIEQQSAAQIRMKCKGSTTILAYGGPNNFSTGSKFLMTVNRDSSGNISTYKDGVLLTQSGSSGNPNTSTLTIDTLGVRDDTDRAFDGIMYELLVYDSEKTGSELTSLHNYLTTKFSL